MIKHVLLLSMLCSAGLAMAQDISGKWRTIDDETKKPKAIVQISIYVDENQRGKRVGQTLLDEMMAMAPSLGIRNVIAVIFAHNTPSVRMFERNGFSLWGTLPNVCELDEDEVSVVLLGKRL